MIASLHALAEFVTLRFLDSLAEGTFVCLLAALVLRVAPRQNAATRFALWFSALGAIPVLPWISGAWLHSRLAVSNGNHAAITLPDSFALYFLALWSLVSVWFAAGVVRALWHLNVLRRNCVPVDTAELDPTVRETLQRHGANRRIVLCTSEQVRVPTAVGLFQPKILVPEWVLRELSPAELNQILLHEFAHFRRWDDWTNLAQQIVKAVFFFHPAVWWIDTKVAVEREVACDDAVLTETRNPRTYAECLAHLAEKSFVNRSIALAQAALGKVRQTSARIARILDGKRPASSSPSWGLAASVLVLAMACGAFYSRTPRLVAFGGFARPLPQEIASAGADSTPVPADFRTVALVQAKFKVPIIQAKLNERKLPHRSSGQVRVVPLRTKSAKTQQPTLVHLTASRVSTVPVREAFWIVVESEGANPAPEQVYQIQMWRVTVLRTVISAPSRQVSRNEI